MIRYIREKRRAGRFAHLLCFVEPVDLIEEYNRFSIHPSVRPVADTRTVCYQPSGETTEVLGFVKSLTQLGDSRVGGAELFESRITRLCQKPRKSSFPTTVKPIRRFSGKGTTVASPRRTPEYSALRGFAAREHISE